MPLLEQYESPLWGIWKIEESWEELLSLSEQSEKYITVLDRFSLNTRKAEWLAVRMLLKRLLNEEAEIAYYETGVPYLPDYSFNISISHTKGYAAVMLDEKRKVGIDIEYYSERIHRIKPRFMNDMELALFPDIDTERLLVCWSAKESAFKAMQERVVDLQTDIHILSFEYSGCRGFLFVKETFTPQQTVYKIGYHITPGFVLTYVL